MRLFVALELNTKVIENLTELVRRLRPFGRVGWVHPRNMHVSLKYIGEWKVHRVDEVVRALNRVRMPVSLTVPLAGMGFFPNSRHPRVFWVGVENIPALRQLGSGVDAELQTLGIAPEVRPYFPHVTLARVLEGDPLDELHLAIEDLPSREFGVITPDRFVLYESSLTNLGAVYRKISEFPASVRASARKSEEKASPMLAGQL